MSYYEESMDGLDQLFAALFQQSQQPARSEVDELQRAANGAGNINIEGNSSTLFPTGFDAMKQIEEDGVLLPTGDSRKPRGL